MRPWRVRSQSSGGNPVLTAARTVSPASTASSHREDGMSNIKARILRAFESVQLTVATHPDRELATAVQRLIRPTNHPTSSTMRSVLSTILAVGTLGSFVAADNIYTYTKPGCSGCAFFFKDIDHNICAVSITGNASSIADAITKGLTTVQSGKLEGMSKDSLTPCERHI
jgi:hypothetical protein